MDEILIDWLQDYVGVDDINEKTQFKDLNFDLFDEAMTVDFVFKAFHKNININNEWFVDVQSLLDVIKL